MRDMTIQIGQKEYNLKYTIRALFLFERITKKPFTANNLEDQFIFFFCLILASNPDTELTFEEFIEAVDNGDLDVSEINKFVAEQQKKQEELAAKKTAESSKKKPSKKKSQ